MKGSARREGKQMRKGLQQPALPAWSFQARHVPKQSRRSWGPGCGRDQELQSSAAACWSVRVGEEPGEKGLAPKRPQARNSGRSHWPWAQLLFPAGQRWGRSERAPPPTGETRPGLSVWRCPQHSLTAGPKRSEMFPSNFTTPKIKFKNICKSRNIPSVH